MKNGLFKKWLAAALCVLALGSTAALAEPDTFYLGTGRNGAHTVIGANNVVNGYARVTNAPASKEDLLQVDSIFCSAPPCFSPGDLVMVLQTTGIVPEPASGDLGAVNLSDKPVGRWELARLKTVSSTGSTAELTLTAPLVHSYTSNVTQVIRVPEYTDLTVDSGATLKAQAWNGRIGGVLAFLATGKVTNNGGTITASGAGFRGGAFVSDGTRKDMCTGLDEPAASGAQRGEGLASTRFGTAQTGRGNVANAGGGGVCIQSGGGGGSNGGSGGRGGNSAASDASRSVGGLGGALVVRTTNLDDRRALLERLTLGGGGGAGHGTDPSGTAGGAGGAGGGIIFIRAGELHNATGSTFSAAGAPGGSSTTDAAGGGGAGGDIYLRVARSITCASATTRLSVSGGTGGNVSIGDYVGPGGGGGAGRILLQAESITCSTSTVGASPGSQLDPDAPGGPAYGALAGGGKPAEIITGAFAPPPPPVVVTPANGLFTNNVRPPINGTTELIPAVGAPAPASAKVYVYVDGKELGPVDSTTASTASWSYALTADLTPGTHQVWAVTEYLGVRSAPSLINTFTVDTKAPEAVIKTGPAELVNTRSATFDLDVREADTGVTYECKLSPATTFTACSDPANFTVPEDGTYTLVVRASDAAGNLGPETAPYTWTVDTKAPVPEIRSGPPALGNSRDVTFDLDVAAPDTSGGVTYQCRLVPVPSTTEIPFTTCTDPADLTVPADGTYRFEVLARDAAGNVSDTPATWNFTVDTTPPNTTIVSGPPERTIATSAMFDFGVEVAEAGVTYECSLDDAAYTSCTDPVTFTGLGDGAHTLLVRAKDTLGNVDSSPESYTWTVDTSAPNTTIVSGPPERTNATSATFDFGVEVAEAGVTYECSLDGAAFTPCTDPVTFTGLDEREHTLLVRARDALGNVDASPASYSWTVDLTAPAVPVVTSPAPGSTVDTLTPAITGSAEPNSTVTVIIDGTEVGTVRADASGNWSYTPTTPLTPGPHEVQVRATDEAGNSSPTSEPRTFTIVQDTSAPETTITTGPSGSTPERTATFEFSSNEPGVTFECSLDGAAYIPCTSPVTFTDLAEGEHTLQVRARDAAGNVDATPATRTWTVDPNVGGDIAFLGDGVGCSATGGDASLLLMGLGTFLTLARRRRRRN